MRSISGYGNLPALHGNAEYPESSRGVYRLVFTSIVYTRSRCVGNLDDIDLFNLFPCDFLIIVRGSLVDGYKKMITYPLNDNIRSLNVIHLKIIS